MIRSANRDMNLSMASSLEAGLWVAPSFVTEDGAGFTPASRGGSGRAGGPPPIAPVARMTRSPATPEACPTAAAEGPGPQALARSRGSAPHGLRAKPALGRGNRRDASTVQWNPYDCTIAVVSPIDI